MWQAKTAAYRAAAARGAVGGSMHVEHRHCAGSTAVGVEKACWLQASGPDISCLADTSSSPLHGSPVVARHTLLGASPEPYVQHSAPVSYQRSSCVQPFLVAHHCDALQPL